MTTESRLKRSFALTLWWLGTLIGAGSVALLFEEGARIGWVAPLAVIADQFRDFIGFFLGPIERAINHVLSLLRLDFRLGPTYQPMLATFAVVFGAGVRTGAMKFDWYTVLMYLLFMPLGAGWIQTESRDASLLLSRAFAYLGVVLLLFHVIFYKIWSMFEKSDLSKRASYANVSDNILGMLAAAVFFVVVNAGWTILESA